MKTILGAIVLSFCLSFGAENGNSYIGLKEKTAWSFRMNDRLTIIQIKNKEHLGGKQCYKVEWRMESADKPAMRSEFWYAKGDSVFSAGIGAFGTVIVYPQPMLIISETTKPGDSWKFVNGKGAFSDSVVYKAESYDSVYFGGSKIIALKITRNGRSPVQTRWFAKGHSIVLEETADAAAPSPFQQEQSSKPVSFSPKTDSTKGPFQSAKPK